MGNQLLLLEDVEHLGRQGDLVRVKPGYARNFLLPKKLAILADKRALKMQEKLQEERKKKAAKDLKKATEIAERLEELTITVSVKVDELGHMYGSIASHDLVGLLQQQAGLELDKKAFQLKHPIKALGVHEIGVKLKEGVVASFKLEVLQEEKES